MQRSGARFAAIVAAAAGLVCLFSCAALLDIRELPVAETDAATDGRPQGGDAGPEACAPRGPNFCEAQCPAPDFCDDFEGKRVGEKWVPIFGVQNPIISGEGKVSHAVDTTGSQTQSLLAEAVSTTDNSASAVLVSGLDQVTKGRKPRGVRGSIETRPATLTWANDGGTSSKVLSFLAVGAQSLNLGIGVLFAEDKPGELHIRIQQRALGGGGETTDLLTLGNARASDFQQNWLGFQFILATPALLAEQGITCTVQNEDDGGLDAGADDLRFVIMLGRLGQKCAALRGPLASRQWLSTAALIAGAAVSDFGTARIYIDNVQLTFLD